MIDARIAAWLKPWCCGKPPSSVVSTATCMYGLICVERRPVGACPGPSSAPPVDAVGQVDAMGEGLLEALARERRRAPATTRHWSWMS